MNGGQTVTAEGQGLLSDTSVHLPYYSLVVFSLAYAIGT